MLDVRRLRLLRELSLRGTLADVAAALHQSPSSVSAQLSQLEKEAGVPLLRKAGRGVQLTAQAEVLVGHTEEILALLELAETELVTSLTEATGTVRMAVFQSAALALLPETLDVLASAHPRLRVTVTQREPATALYETWVRDFDLVIAEQYPGHAAPHYPDLDRKKLTTDAIHLAVPASGDPWNAIRTITDAKDVPWVMEPHGAASRHWAEQVCRRAGFEPDVRFETADLQAHLALIESGNAVGLIPDLMRVRREPAVRLVALANAPKRTIFTAARRSSGAQPGIIACRLALGHAVQCIDKPADAYS